jgi:GT2 family glycosyltransferase/glycosyltransferase involved in cell wall biosynthesis
MVTSSIGSVLGSGRGAFLWFVATTRTTGLAVACRKTANRIQSRCRSWARDGERFVLDGRLVRLTSGYFPAARLMAQYFAMARSDGLVVATIRATRKIWKGLVHHRRLSRLINPAGRCLSNSPPLRADTYEVWRRLNRGNSLRRRQLANARCPQHDTPRFSILVPVYDPPLDVFRAMIVSVIEQTYPSWELILVNDAGSDPRVRQEMQTWSSRDRRVNSIDRVQNGNISLATNDAAAASKGEFLVFLDHDDLLDPDALAHFALYLDAHPETDLIYSDDDKIGADGVRHSPQFKPDWSPELLLTFCYTAHLSAVSARLYRELGGLRVGFEGSQDHDFWLRAGERARHVGHVAQVLYHWRVLPGSTASSGNCKPASFEAGRRAVEEAFARRGVPCEVRRPDWAVGAGCSIFEPVMPDNGPSVAILVPTCNNKYRLNHLLESLAKTTYQNYRVYVIDNESDATSTLRYLASLPHRVVRIPNPDGGFNFAGINNAAAAMVTEDLLLFLNDDIEVINPRWLSQMVGWSRLPGVGAVGARLLYADRTVQHAGIVHGFHDGPAGHAFRYLPWWDPGYWNLARISRNCLAVTAACLLTPRTLFIDQGGFDDRRFPVAYNDADYGYRLGDAGYRCVYCAEAELYHHEGLSRSRCDDPRGLAMYRQIHGRRVDPYFSPHLDPELEIFETRPTVVPVGAVGRPVSILAVTHNLNWEGAPRFEFELLSRLKAAGAVDPEVISPCDGPMRSAYEQKGITIRVEPRLAGLAANLDSYTEGTAYLSDLIERRGYEVVHANTLQTYWAIEAARAARTPSVWSVHESEPWQTYFDRLPQKIAAKALACLSYPYRVVFSATSSALVWSDLNSTDNFGLIRFPLDNDRFKTLLSGVDRQTARAEFGLKPDDFCVLLLGTVCERKGQHDLVRAFKSLPGAIAARTTCLVVGSRDSLAYSRKLAEMVRLLPEDRRHRFHVFPETGETAAYWRAADVFCCTSRASKAIRM